MEWIWGSTDAPRAGRARKVEVIEFSADEPPRMECAGSDGAQYHATLDACSCPDFSINQKRGKPAACKHMVCLAMRLGILNGEGRTEKDQFMHDFLALENRLALLAWKYYVLDAPEVSDAEYDRLKADYLERLTAIRSQEGEK